MHIEPGGHDIVVSAGDNVLAAALAAGIALPHSCREGRCASCKARLLAGDFVYPLDRLPPGITAAEAARGEVLLCQARPRSDLSIESRRTPARAAQSADASLEGIEVLPLGALRLRVRVTAGSVAARPGQFVDLRNPAGDELRVAVTAARASEFELEAAPDGSHMHAWLAGRPAAGVALRLAGPFDRPR